MAIKTTDIPQELRGFWGLFSRLCQRHNYSQVFDDYLTIVLTQFVPPGQMEGWHADAIKKYDDKERALINSCFTEMIMVYSKQITTDNEWYDFFGNLYQTLSSTYKSSALGQFFTPEHLCTMMAQLLQDEDKEEPDKVSDPTCGSGRMLLAHNSLKPGFNYYYAEDLDLMCCKMTAINMAMHGMRGEVVNHNSLSEPDTFRHAWRINDHPVFKGMGVPHIIQITDPEKCFVTARWKYRVEEIKKTGVPEPEAKKQVIEEKKEQQTGQLSLF